MRAAIEANPRARKIFKTLGRQNLFALTFRTNKMRTPAGREKKIAELVDMLARGETIYPERPRTHDGTRTSRRHALCRQRPALKSGAVRVAARQEFRGQTPLSRSLAIARTSSTSPA